MDFATTLANINWLSVIAAAISSFVIGGIWYGPLFGKTWMSETGFTESDLKGRNMAWTFGLSLVLAFIAALVLEMFIGPEANAAFGTMAGVLAGVGWVSTMLGILYLFEMKSGRAYLVNAGYCVVTLMVMGLILGAW